MRMWMCVLLAGCASGPVVRSVPVQFVPDTTAVKPGEGVEIALGEARLTVSDLRLERPAETSAMGWWPSLIPVAHAHPGHDFTGDVGGELLGTWTLDLLGDASELGLATLRDGDYASARLELVGDPELTLVGTATVDGAPVPFDFTLALDEAVTGIAFAVSVPAAGGATGMALGVDLDHALSFSNWRTDPGDDGLLTESDGTLANTLTFGVLSAPTWNLTLEDGR